MEASLNEIFTSIQGEGSKVGMPAFFVRFAGCNRVCSFCDTDHKENFRMSVIDLSIEFMKSGVNNIIFTGGEPLLQIDFITEFVDFIENKFCSVNFYLETNATIYPKNNEVLNKIFVIASPKENYSQKFLEDFTDEIKLLIDSKESLEIYKNTIIKNKKKYFQVDYIYLQAEWSKCIELLPEILLTIFKYKFCRLSGQLHKYLNLR
jgi:7-carboxy-7-deazaguanine synthase